MILKEQNLEFVKHHISADVKKLPWVGAYKVLFPTYVQKKSVTSAVAALQSNSVSSEDEAAVWLLRLRLVKNGCSANITFFTQRGEEPLITSDN